MLKRAAGRDRRTSAKARSKSTSGGAAAIGVGLAFLALAAWPSPDGCDLERRLEQDRGEQRFRPRTSRDGARQFGVALAQKRPHQALKGLHQRRIGNVALVLLAVLLRTKPLPLMTRSQTWRKAASDVVLRSSLQPP